MRDERQRESGQVLSPRRDILAVVMGVTFALIWSSAFSTAKVALVDAPPLLFLVARFLLAGLIAVAAAFAMGQRLPARWRHYGFIAVLGVCQNSLYLGLFFIAMTTVPAGLAAIIASTMPLVVAAASLVVFNERLGALGRLGLVLGFLGVVLVMSDRLGNDLDALGIALCFVGVIALAGATLLVRHANLGGGLMMVVGLQMLIGAVVLAPAAIVMESASTIRITPSLVAAFVYITLIPGLAATLLWFNLIRRVGAARASAYHFLNPAFGVAIAWLVLGERFSSVDAAGVAVVTIGILLVQRDRL